MVATSTLRQRLKPGMEFSYGELCKALGEEKKTGNSQVAQLKDWEQYINFTRKGRVYTILDVYTHPHIDYTKIPIDVKLAHNSKTAKLYAYLLQDYLRDQIYKEGVFYSSQLYQGLGLLRRNIEYETALKYRLLYGYENQEKIDELYSKICATLKMSCKYKYDNFRATSWFKNYFMSEVIYCGIREGCSELFDIQSEAPSIFKWTQQAYAIKNILKEEPGKQGCIDFNEIRQKPPCTRSFISFLAQSLHLCTCFMGIKIWQIRDLPEYPEWDSEKAREEIHDYAVASHVRTLKRKYPNLDSQRVEDFVYSIMPTVLDKGGSSSIWVDLYKSSNLIENCKWE